jgi:uncharacterized protein (DUF427 family)
MGFSIRSRLATAKGSASPSGGPQVMRATWRGATLAESAQTIVIEGTHYFPPASVNMALLQASSTHTVCPTKGQARYYSIAAGGKIHRDAAWYYPDPSPEAMRIRGYVAFWRGVEVRSQQRWVPPGKNAPGRRGA